MCSNGKCDDLKCDSIMEMKRRFLQEIILSWNQKETDRGTDQWLDPVDCKGCHYSFKDLVKHLSKSKSDCQTHYSRYELEKLGSQKRNLSTFIDKEEEAINKRFYEEKRKQLSAEDKMRLEEIRKTYRPKIEEEVHVEVPSYLQPFMLEEDHECPGDNKVNKKLIKIKNCN